MKVAQVARDTRRKGCGGEWLVQYKDIMTLFFAQLVKRRRDPTMKEGL